MKNIFYVMFCSLFILNSTGFVLAEKNKNQPVSYTHKEIKKKFKEGVILVTVSADEIKKIKEVIADLSPKNKRKILEQYLKRAEYYKLQANASTYPANRKSHLNLAGILASVTYDCSIDFPLLKKQAKEFKQSLAE